MFEFQQNLTTDEVITKMSAPDMQKKTVTYVMELIATKLADEWIRQHGDSTLKAVGVEELKAELAERINKRLLEMSKPTKNETS